jgi:excisionase family DNA binding protein
MWAFGTSSVELWGMGEAARRGYYPEFNAMPVSFDAGDPGTSRPPSQPELLGIDAFADLLGVSTRHVRRLTDAGRCPPPVRLGKSVRWSRRTVEAWIADGCPSNCRRRPGVAR